MRPHDARMQKMKMPMFFGDDVHGWMYRIEWYFDAMRIPVQEQLATTGVCFEGPTLN